MYVEPFRSPRTIAIFAREDPFVGISRPSLVWSASGRTATVWCHRSGHGSGFWLDLYIIDVDEALRSATHLGVTRRVTTGSRSPGRQRFGGFRAQDGDVRPLYG
jgi:hypothetical protein